MQKFIEEDSPELIDDINTFSNLILIFSPLLFTSSLSAVGPAVTIIADFLGVKNEIAQSGRRLIEKIKGKQDNDSLTKLRRMETAYWLISFTAFFEAVDKRFPELIKSVGLTSKEKWKLSQSAIERLQKNTTEIETALPAMNVGPLDVQLHLPHPIDGFDDQKKQLTPLYEELTKGFLSFLECLALWDIANDRQRNEIKMGFRPLPELAFSYFRGQYYQLALEYEEFYIWSNLHEHEETRSSLRKMSLYLQKHTALVEASQKVIDVGLHQLSDVIKSMPDYINAKHANSVIAELGKLYASAIEEPIIKDTSIDVDGNAILTYPKKSEIFIPQAYKVIRYSGKEQLENEITWKHQLTRNDLAGFLLSYLSSPYSCLSPLIILGHPGSGKSLLTSILAARLASPRLTPIRVELRNINADNEIAVQIEDQIYKNTARKINWASLSDHFQDRPALVILDGYDELLQASGKVFSGYLQKVQKFQENEMSLGRQPVRTIVTSRITLIDKAIIPVGATIIRLLEFDEEKRNKWISVWNTTNRQYFAQTQAIPFELPRDNKQIIALAEQPLLLLMLALYDSDNNQLGKSQGLDQTILYDSLLRRFIERERTKDEDFKVLSVADHNHEIEKDMERLGAAALGMFNRRSLHIKSSQLSADLSFFQLERQVLETSGRLLSQADLLLGSFFFIQESKSVHKDEDDQPRNIDAAFEFLHNTFGEFLTADFILRRILAETHKLYKLRNDDELRSLLDQMMVNANGLPKEWFTCLMYTSLFSRPVILAMMREWINHNLNQKKRHPKDFIKDLDTIVSNQIRRLLTSNELPSIMMERGQSSFDNLPILGYTAIYSLNLILLRTVLDSEGYTFDEENILPFEDGTRAWDRLTYLWRSWFSLENLNGLTAILTAERDGTKIHLKAKKLFITASSASRLESYLSINMTLADNIGVGLSGLLLYDSSQENADQLNDIENRLMDENINLQVEIMTKRLQNLRKHFTNYQQAEMLVMSGINIIEQQSNRQPETITSLLSECIDVARMVNGITLLHRIYDSFIYSGWSNRLPISSIIILTKLARDLGDKRFIEYIYREYYKELETETLPVDFVLELIRLAREMREKAFLEFVYRKYVKTFYNQFLPAELVIEIIKLAREYKDQNLLQYFYYQYRKLLLFGSLPLEVGIEILKLIREFGYDELPDYFYNEYFARVMNHHNGLYSRYRSQSRLVLGKQYIRLLLEILKLARELNNRRFLHFFYEEYLLERFISVRSLPVNALDDIHWVAIEMGDSDLLEEVSKRIKSK